MRSLYQKIIDQKQKVNCGLLLFLLLLLNVKLIVKLAAFLVIILSQYRKVSLKEIFKQKHLFFYFALIGIAIFNYIIQPGDFSMNSALSAGFGIFLWLICAAASYWLFRIVQKEKIEKLHNTILFFFALHVGLIFLNLLMIMVECGTINPYTYTGFNQKYYISTGDFISGITFDSPVTTAIISAFAILYFLYRRHFLLSLAAMVGLLISVSNLTNIFLVIILMLIFIFHSDKLQKSLIVLQLVLLVIFIAKISPQNNEYVGRFGYKMLGLTYDLPKKIESIALIKSSPDSLLTAVEIRKKTAARYLDSINLRKLPDSTITKKIILPKEARDINSPFFQYTETEAVINKKNKYHDFLVENYSVPQKDSLQKLYDWNKPGKWIAAKQIFSFFKEHPGKILSGTGTGKFSSRVAFKTTSLGMAGSYPVKYAYIHPWFLNNHLHLYTYYHSQPQPKHAAENTPDSTYGQLISEYGIAGLLSFLVLYAWYFFRHSRRLSFGLPVMLLTFMAFFVEYWFEQLSIVILFEFLLFLDIKSSRKEFLAPEEQPR